MRRLTVILMCAVCAVMNVVAQTVASSPTAVSALKSGYYVLKMKSDKTDADGSFVYRNGSNVMFDAKGAAHDLTGKAVDDVSYVFYVADNGGQLTIKAFDKKDCFWPAIPAPKANDKECNPGQQSKIALAASGQSFTPVASADGWSYLKTSATKFVKKGLIWWPSYNTYNVDIYVVANSGNVLGYWDTGASASNNAQFQFYAVDDMYDAADVVSFNYEFCWKGEVKKSQAVSSAIAGRAFPQAAGLPEYVEAPLPTRKVEAGDDGQTFKIDCVSTLPFQLSTDEAPVYYYLENVQGTRLYNNNGSLAFRTAVQADELNNVRNDLFYVTGNAFDGYQFTSVGAGKNLHSELVMSHSTKLLFSGSSKSTSTWEIFMTEGGFAVCPVVGSSYYYFGATEQKFLTAANNKNYAWRLDDDAKGIGFKNYSADDEGFAFRMVEPTFEVELYDVPGQGTFNSTALPFDFTIAKDYDGDAKLYKGTVEGKELMLSEVGRVPANAGVVLMGTNSEHIKLVATAGVEALGNNDLIGTTSEIAVGQLDDKLIFGVSNETGLVGFFSTDGSASLPANRAYLNKVEGLMAVMVNHGGNTTAIGNVQNSLPANAPVYDLSGRRVTKMVKGGLYLQNGRKFIAQ